MGGEGAQVGGDGARVEELFVQRIQTLFFFFLGGGRGEGG